MASPRHWTPVLEDVQMEHTTVSSTVLSLLPTSLKSRLPPLRSVRKSVSMQTCQATVTSRTPPLHESTEPTPRGTPQKQSLIADSPSRHSYASTLVDDEPIDSAPPSPPSGVQWQYAQQGLSLLSVAQDEARQPLAGADFERKAFLDGAEYIMKALPTDLSPRELDRLRTSAPPALVLASPGGDCAASESSGQRGRSRLHRWVQAAVVQAFVLVQLALPYVVLLVRLAARAEREYNISQNVASAGWRVAHAIGAQGVRATETLCGIGEGRVGQAVAEAVAWTVEGVSGGLSEGVGQGMVIMGVPRQ